MARSKANGGGGDRRSGWVRDPTENVISLNEASVKRLDDLLAMASRYSEQIAQLRAEHFREMTATHAEHDRQIHRAEQERWNSIRDIDVAARVTEADRNLAAIQTLATQTAANAETIRAALVSTATTIANSTAATVGALSERIAALEKTSYEGAGKQAVADPAIEKLVTMVERLALAQSMGSGKSAGAASMWGYVAGGILLLVMMLGGFGTLVTIILRFAGKG